MPVTPAFLSVARPFLDPLHALYGQMDAAYAKTAASYGFECAGCSENCCLTRFYHHTHIEFAGLMQGFYQLETQAQHRIRQEAAEVNRRVTEAMERRLTPRVMCPVNGDGRCRLYAFRPMICRLHGLPHEFCLPGKHPVYGPGCHEFDRRCADKGYVRFDRTPFYRGLALLEQAFQQQTGLAGKLKKTVAQMLHPLDDATT